MTNNSHIVIRQVSAQDVIAVAKQVGHSSQDVLDVWQARADAGRMVMFAAFNGSHAVGSVNIMLDGADEAPVLAEIGKVPMINALGVILVYRGQGIGQQLLKACEKYMREHPELPQQLALGVEPANTAACRLYDRVGYQQRLIAGAQLFETSWPEYDANGQRYIFRTECRLLVKAL